MWKSTRVAHQIEKVIEARFFDDGDGDGDGECECDGDGDGDGDGGGDGDGDGDGDCDIVAHQIEEVI
jgi:hypothetical protein